MVRIRTIFGKNTKPAEITRKVVRVTDIDGKSSNQN